MSILRRLSGNSSYLWDIFPSYDIFKVNEYGNILAQITNNEVYDAEAVISPDGKKILYTSREKGDLDIYIMELDGSNKKQLTNITGYDGGGSFSPDSNKIVFRASRPKTAKEVNTYTHLLQYDLVATSEMELYVMNADGTDQRPIFNKPLGNASWAPSYHPDNKRIIFSSNFNSTCTSDFNLYIVNEDGTGLEQVTYNEGHFDAFPVFSHDGKSLVWSSTRGSADSRQINVFIADWVDPGQSANDENDAKEEIRTNRVPKRLTEEFNSQKNETHWQDTTTTAYDNVVHFEGERHFKNVKQLTFRGQNAEGYF
ncbi:Translocation protein TolB, partial [Trichostrongylus colubriformis]